MSIRFLLTFIIVLIVSYAFCQNRSYNLNYDSLYNSPEGSVISDNPSLKNSLRYREFLINPALQQANLIQKNDTLILDLFEDCQYKAFVTGISSGNNGSLMINGRLKDYKFSSLFISTAEGKSFIQIDIPEKEEMYTVNYIHDQGIYYLKQQEHIKIEKFSKGMISPEINENKVDILQSKSISPNNLRVTDTQETIKLLIAYTPETVKWSKKNATDINNVLDIITAKNQLVMDNSKTNVTIKLVCAVEVDYTEEDMGKDFDHFGNQNDGYMDEVHALRDYYYADIMIFISGINYWGGLGCQFSGGKEWAFAVADPTLSVYGYTAIHEIGHILGAKHYIDHGTDPPASYNHAWSWHDPKDDKYYGTVMAYTFGDSWPDGNGRARVPHFSNPDIKYNDIATGVANAYDNARRIRETKSIAAKFREENCAKPSVPKLSNVIMPDCTKKGSVTLSNLPAGGWTMIRFPDNKILSGNTSSTTFYMDEGTYDFAVINSNRCPSEKTKSITFKDNRPVPEIKNIIQPTCLHPFGNVELDNLPNKGELIIHSETGDSKIINPLTKMYVDLEAGKYSFSAKTSAGCESALTREVTLLSPIPEFEILSQPTCSKSTGTVHFSNLPSGTWEIHDSSNGNIILTGNTNSAKMELSPGTYLVELTTKNGCYTEFSDNIVINEQPVLETPLIQIIQDPNCSDPTGSIVVSELPKGAWTLTRLPDNKEYSGSGTKLKIEDIPAGTYSFNVTNSENCTSKTSDNINLFLISSIPQPSITQKGSVLSSSPSATYQWYLFNEPIGGAIKKDYTVVREGEYHVVVYDGQCYSNPSDKMYITINGIADIKTSLKIYPNPADSELSLELPDNNELVHFDIFSASGELFHSSEFTNSITIDLKQWPSGVYIIKTFNNKISTVNKFVKN